MSGGIFTAQNKIRPGAYLNFVSTPRSSMAIGDRGIAIIPMPLSWGVQDELITVYSTDMLDNRSLAKVGFTAFDANGRLLNLLLSNCHTALVFRSNKGGTKASAILGDLTVTARYTGTLGNSIHISIIGITAFTTLSTFEDTTLFELEGKSLKEVTETIVAFEVRTYVNAVLKDTQRVTDISELIPNDFVTFSGLGELSEYAGELLAGGTDGIIDDATAYPEFLELANIARWQTMAVPIKNDIISRNIVNFIKEQRDGQGRYVQAVVCDYYNADFEGIINNTMGVVIDGEEVTKEEFVAWVAGATAGAAITQSLTGKVVSGATSIIGELDNAGIIEALQKGNLVLSRNQNGDIAVERDINSLTTFTQDKNDDFSNNQVIRILDEIGTSTKNTWETSYKGKVQNNENGQAAYRGDIVNYLNSLQNTGVIQEFLGADDVEVIQGEKINAVVSNLRVKPSVAMEFLYMTVNVQS